MNEGRNEGQEMLEARHADIDLRYAETGKKISIGNEGGRHTVQVNLRAFDTPEAAERAGVIEAAQVAQIGRFIETDPKTIAHGISKHLIASARLAGVGRLRAQQPALARRLARASERPLSTREAFRVACEQYILVGEIPSEASPAVQDALRRLSQKGGKNALDFIASGAYSGAACAMMYEQHIIPALERVVQEEKDTRQTQGDAYRPQTGDTTEAPLEESQIEQRVEPFYGGYYRSRVYRYSPASFQIVEDAGEKHAFAPDIPEGTIDNLKRYRFRGVFDPTKENVLALPYAALPLVSTLVSPGKLKIMRDARGVFSVEAEKRWFRKAARIEYSFEFVLARTKHNRINDEPDARDSEPAGWETDAETEGFLGTLPGLVPADATGRIMRFVRGKFAYPKDASEHGEMDRRYLASQENVFHEMCSHGIADCHWSNIFANELCKRTGLSARLPAGFHVSKDPRFDFAPLAGTGHAWSEVWIDGEWKRYDATPPKENEDEEEGEEGEAPGDYGDTAEPEDENVLTPEEVEALFQEMLEKPEPSKEPSRDPEVFPGVPASQWRRVEQFIAGVNAMRVPETHRLPLPEGLSSSEVQRIRRLEGTLAGEYEKLFWIIYKRREVVRPRFRGPVPMSQGEYLDDPVDAAIDVRAGEPDPYGYRIAASKKHTESRVSKQYLANILDLTGSMKGSGAYLTQKQAVLVESYNVMQLNRRLNLSHYKQRMGQDIVIRQYVGTFKGETTTQRLHGPEEEMTEKRLCTLYDALDDTQVGSGDLRASLAQYRASITPEMENEMRRGELSIALTITSDGAVADQSSVVRLVRELRSLGVVVQGLGFGEGAESIRVICHDPKDPDAALVLSDITQAPLARYRLLAKRLQGV